MCFRKCNTCHYLVIFNHVVSMLKNIQKQSIQIRRRIAAILTILIFCIVTFFWISFVGFNISGESGQINAGERVSPFSLIENSFSGIADEISGLFASAPVLDTGTDSTTTASSSTVLLGQ